MSMLIKQVGVATVGVALGLVALKSQPAQAAIFNYNFTVSVTDGPLSGQTFTGSFSYDDDDLIDSGPVEFLFQPSLTFNFLDTVFDATNDAAYAKGFFPFLYFQNGQLLGLDYLVTEVDDLNPTSIPGPITGFLFSQGLFQYDTVDSDEPFQGQVTYTLRPDQPPEEPPVSVPEPSMLAGLAVLATGYWLRRLRQT